MKWTNHNFIKQKTRTIDKNTTKRQSKLKQKSEKVSKKEKIARDKTNNIN